MVPVEHRPLWLGEDRKADARLTTLALTRAGFKCPIVRCHDGDHPFATEIEARA